MAFTKEIDDKEWHKIGDKLTDYFGICGCQRKLKTIVDNFVLHLYETSFRERNRRK